jgi:hypothetical protein
MFKRSKKKNNITLGIGILCIFVLTQFFLSRLKPKARLEPFEGLYNAIYIYIYVYIYIYIYDVISSLGAGSD